jgi:hypothetical protein
LRAAVHLGKIKIGIKICRPSHPSVSGQTR